MAVLCSIITIQYSPQSGPLYETGVSLGPPVSLYALTQTAYRSVQPFLPGSPGDRPTDRPTDNATRSVTIGGAHSGEAKFCYCLWLQQVFIGAVDSTDRINFSNQQQYIFSCKTRRVAVYLETHCNIGSKRAFPTSVLDR